MPTISMRRPPPRPLARPTLPTRGEGMGANDLNYKSETPADPLPPVGRGAGWGSDNLS